MSVKPVGKNIIVKIVEKKPASNIVLPDGLSLDKEIAAEVIAVSDDCERGLKPGDEILARPGAEAAAIPIPKADKELILPESFVLAILNYEEDA